MPEDRPLIAVAQYAPVLGAVETNRGRARGAIAAAADEGCSLVVLPECCLTGYAFPSRESLCAAAEPVSGPSIAEWRDLAHQKNIYVVGGLAERGAARELYNSAVLIAPTGEIALYRKCHLFGPERELFTAGDRLVCQETPWGIVGLAICYDLWFPEMTRALALAGATLIAVPANWFRTGRLLTTTEGGRESDGLPPGFHLAVAGACSNEVTIACADRIGEDRGLTFIGGSCIVGPDGHPLAGPASRNDETCLVARWPDVAAFRRSGQSHLLARRPELYLGRVVVTSPANRPGADAAFSGAAP